MSDNEDTCASLGQTEILSVENSVGEPKPAVPQSPEHGSKCPSAVNRQDAGDVLPDHPTGPQEASQLKEFNREVATLTIQPRSKSGDAEILTWRASDQNVNW